MKQVNISQVDALFANGIYPIEFLFHFKQGIDTKKIRNALKKLSSIFWPLFGEYRDGVISFEKYVEDECYDEEAVGQEFHIPPTEKERLDVYSQYKLPDTKKLFHLKITQFENGKRHDPGPQNVPFGRRWIQLLLLFISTCRFIPTHLTSI